MFIALISMIYQDMFSQDHDDQKFQKIPSIDETISLYIYMIYCFGFGVNKKLGFKKMGLRVKKILRYH